MKKNAASTMTFSEVVSSPADGSHQLKTYQEPPAAQVTCSYDIAGNMTSDGSSKLYYYDHENRLVYIDSATDFWFRYDALGRRILEKEGTTETLLYYDGAHIAEETTAGLAVNRISVFGEKIDDVLYSGGVDGSGNLINNRWPFVDRLGTVAAVVDDDGNVQTELDYTAFGETTRTGAEVYPYGFTGRRYIQTAELYDYRARSYDPRLGRFMQRDPIGIWGDESNFGNAFSYVGEDPVNDADPFGLESEKCRQCCDEEKNRFERAISDADKRYGACLSAAADVAGRFLYLGGAAGTADAFYRQRRRQRVQEDIDMLFRLKKDADGWWRGIDRSRRVLRASRVALARFIGILDAFTIGALGGAFGADLTGRVICDRDYNGNIENAIKRCNARKEACAAAHTEVIQEVTEEGYTVGREPNGPGISVVDVEEDYVRIRRTTTYINPCSCNFECVPPQRGR